MDSAGWFNQTYLAMATVVATFLGPITAVLVTRWVDYRRAQYQRRLQIFRDLMRWRRQAISQDFVGALNLVEVEFFNEPSVISAWKGMLADFNKPPVPESRPDLTEQLVAERNRLKAILLDSIAKVLRIKIEQLDIYHGGYTPQGWHDLESEQTIIRRFFADVGSGRRALPVIVVPLPADTGQSPEVISSAKNQK